MTSSTSTPPPSSSQRRSRTPPSPNGHLPRGKACMNCRRRKIKCDGEKPMCGQCSRSRGLFDDCEYSTGGKTRTQILEENIIQLQKRIRDLESANEANPTTVPLHNPYVPENILSSLLSTHGHDDVGSSPGSSASPSPEQLSILEQEPSFDIIQHLLYTFQRHAAQIGYFLHTSRLGEALMNDAPFAQPPQFCQSLLYAMMLWGARLSATLPNPSDEQRFLSKSLSMLHRDLDCANTQRIVQVLQAEVLLAFYYLNEGRLLEGNYHTSAALSLCYSSKFHMIRSERAPRDGSIDMLGRELHMPLNGISSALEEEQINGFWTVLRLNCYCIAFQGTEFPSPLTLPYGGVDTPWPQDTNNFERNVRRPMQTAETLQKFMDGTSVDGSSTDALYVKASLLVERATAISSIITLKQNQEYPAQPLAFTTLHHVIEKLRNSLPLLDGMNDNMTPRQTLITIHCLVHLATIRLHFPLFEQIQDSRDRCIVAATAISRMVPMLPLQHMSQIDPILGLIWFTACEVFQKVLAEGDYQAQSFIPEMVQTITSAMLVFTHQSYLLQLYLSRAQQLFSGILTI